MGEGAILLVSGAAHFSTRDVWEGYVDGLQAVGADIVPYPLFSLRTYLSREAIGHDIVAKCLDVRNDICAAVFVDGLFFREDLHWVLDTLNENGIVTCVLETEEPYSSLDHSQARYSLRFTNEIMAAHGSRTHYLPTATQRPPAFELSEFARDVVFVGTVFEDRLHWIRALAEACEERQLRFDLFGHIIGDPTQFDDFEFVSFTSGTVPSHRKWELYSHSRIVLNVFRESEDEAASPNPRIFEVAALGIPALLSGPHRSEVGRIFGDSVFEFSDQSSMIVALDAISSDEACRQAKVRRAREIALDGHLYAHRAQSLLETLRSHLDAAGRFASPQPIRSWWIFGAPRSGSTWLLELLQDLPGYAGWHEPYFGALLSHAVDNPIERERPNSIYSERHWPQLAQSMRDLFFSAARSRFDLEAGDTLIVKDVNSPELCPFFAGLFPDAGMILLLRDPYDVLDSFLDMQKKGGWNEALFAGDTSQRVRQSANRIRHCFELALAGYEEQPADRRMIVRYENLRGDPSATLTGLLQGLGPAVEPDDVLAAIESNRFENHRQRGTTEFRRFAQVARWQVSPNFDEEVRSLAREELGELRARLGYENVGASSRMSGS